MNSGHARNVLNFEKVVSILVGIDGKYAPLNGLITKDALNSKLSDLRNALSEKDEERLKDLLYHPDHGALKLVELIKIQLIIYPGRDSLAFKQVNDLTFRKW
ncbi:MAG: hypothetical protein KIS76_17370 [Pyrinomonadaceae bacterium]|nr:hypothetical protein [Pyrinomonadaceae bacterium]